MTDDNPTQSPEDAVNEILRISDELITSVERCIENHIDAYPFVIELVRRSVRAGLTAGSTGEGYETDRLKHIYNAIGNEP